MKRISYIAFVCLILLTFQSAKAGDVASQERKIKIGKVDGLFSILAQDPTQQYLESASTLATQSTLQLGVGSKDWGPTNPHWQSIYGQVSKDIQSDINKLLSERRYDIASSFKTRLADTLSNEDVNALTEFCRSRNGKRYFQMSNQIAGLITDTAIHMNDVASIKPKAQPTADELKSWGRFIAVSSSTQIFLGLIEKNKQAGQDTSGSSAISIIYGTAMVLHQDEFRNIASANENDLNDFTAFIESPIGKHLVEAQIVTANELESMMSEFSIDLMDHIKMHETSWKKMYAMKVEGISEPVQQQTTRQQTISKEGTLFSQLVNQGTTQGASHNDGFPENYLSINPQTHAIIPWRRSHLVGGPWGNNPDPTLNLINKEEGLVVVYTAPGPKMKPGTEIKKPLDLMNAQLQQKPISPGQPGTDSGYFALLLKKNNGYKLLPLNYSESDPEHILATFPFYNYLLSSFDVVHDRYLLFTKMVPFTESYWDKTIPSWENFDAWWLNVKNETIEHIVLPAGPWVSVAKQEDAFLSYEIKVEKGSIFVSISGHPSAINEAVMGSYRLKEDGKSWEKVKN